jgi:DNA mismatch repair protein MLH3
MCSTASSVCIRPLAPEAIAQIKSSIAIVSLNGVVLELLKNSLDASANRVEIAVEYSRGNCTVEDDGLGITPLEFQEGGGLGKPYHTSKINGSPSIHGSRGSVLASVAALSLVSITSHHHEHRSHNTVSISRSQVIARQCPAPPQQHITASKHGTRVVVRDLFGNMPVRVKQRAVESDKQLAHSKEWEELRKDAISLVLAWPLPVNIFITDAMSSQKILLRGLRQADPMKGLRNDADLVAHICNTLSQASLITSPECSKWIPMNASTTAVRINGAISLEPAPTKGVQFLSLGINPLDSREGYSFLYDEINRIFKNSSFGNEDDVSDLDNVERMRRSKDRRYKSDGFTTKELKGSGKGIDRWPMFYLRVELVEAATCNVGHAANYLLDNKMDILTSVVELLEAMVLEFLRSQHFRPKLFHLQSVQRKRQAGSASSPLPVRSTLDTDKIVDDIKERGQNESNSGDRLSTPRSSQKSSVAISESKRKPRKMAHTERAESVFNTWSRVKSGKPKLATSITEQESSRKYTLERKEVEFLSTKSESEIRSESKLAKSGKVIRPPFGNLPAASSEIRPPVAIVGDDLRVFQESYEKDSGDKLVPWLNPLTKESSFINTRTGLVVQSRKIGRVTPRITYSYKSGSVHQSSNSDGVKRVDETGLTDEYGIWISKLLRKWNNPVFRPTEGGIPQVSWDGPDVEAQQLSHGQRHSWSQLEIDMAFQTSSAAGLAGRISRKALQEAEIISQVDKKFILTRVTVNDEINTASEESMFRKALVIVDQHAADERCRLEELLTELCTAPADEEIPTSRSSMRPGVLSIPLDKPINFVMSDRETSLLQTHSQHFANWGILYDIPTLSSKTDQHKEHKVTVRSLPPGIIERSRTIPKLLVELLRSEAWKCHETIPVQRLENSRASHHESQIMPDEKRTEDSHPWLKRIHSCPQGILDMLNSRSCRSKTIGAFNISS